MAEATTVMDPATQGQAEEAETAVATVPTTGPMAVLYRLTGGQSIRQALPALGAIIVAVIGMVFFVLSQQPGAQRSMRRFPRLKRRGWSMR